MTTRVLAKYVKEGSPSVTILTRKMSYEEIEQIKDSKRDYPADYILRYGRMPIMEFNYEDVISRKIMEGFIGVKCIDGWMNQKQAAAYDEFMQHEIDVARGK